MLNRMRDHLKGFARPCFPKEQHPSKEAAEAQLRSLTRRGLQKNRRIHTYRCPECHAWHVGHGSK